MNDYEIDSHARDDLDSPDDGGVRGSMQGAQQKRNQGRDNNVARSGESLFNIKNRESSFDDTNLLNEINMSDMPSVSRVSRDSNPNRDSLGSTNNAAAENRPFEYQVQGSLGGNTNPGQSHRSNLLSNVLGEGIGSPVREMPDQEDMEESQSV